MDETSFLPKIKSIHIALLAIIYIRQSSDFQVNFNTGSTERQYALRKLALRLGWPEERIVIVDQDQGLTATTTEGRIGYQWAEQQISEGNVGALFCVESTRLSRESLDLISLIKTCAESDTLIIDEQGVHDPNNDGDHLLLCLLAILGEADSRNLRHKLNTAKLEKIKKGECIIPVPIGLIRDLTGAVRKDPNEEVCKAVELIFSLYRKYGSMLAVVRHFNSNNLLFPTRVTLDHSKSKVTWVKLTLSRVATILHNPSYTGAMTYGRTKMIPHKGGKEKGKRKKHRVSVARSEWIIIHNVYPKYISWEEFICNEEQLSSRKFSKEGGPIMNGAALLSGIIYCGVCGYQMGTYYPGNATAPHHCCRHYETTIASVGYQTTISGRAVNAAFTNLFLGAINPAQLEVSLATLEQAEAREAEINAQFDRQIERAKYDADIAKIRFESTDARNRLVAKTYEDEMNDCLERLHHLEKQRYARLSTPPQILTPENRDRILALPQDLPKLWNGPATTNSLRKQLIQTLVRKVTIDRKDKAKAQMTIEWKTGIKTSHTINLMFRRKDTLLDPSFIDRIRELKPTHSDREIAEIFNKEGLRTRRGTPFTEVAISSIRKNYQIEARPQKGMDVSSSEQRSDGRYNLPAVSRILGVSRGIVARLCISGRIDALRDSEDGRWWIELSHETLDAFSLVTRMPHVERAA